MSKTNCSFSKPILGEVFLAGSDKIYTLVEDVGVRVNVLEQQKMEEALRACSWGSFR